MQPKLQTPNQQPTQWQFTQQQVSPINTNTQNNNNNQVAVNQQASNVHISWTASEFIAYYKGAGWYIVATIVLIIISTITYFLSSQDIISTVVIFIIGAIFIGFSLRKPRVLNYEVSNQGIRIGEKLYSYKTLKSFAVIEEETMRSIDLLPLQRFMPAISMYYEPNDETAIVDALSIYLPKEDRKQPLIDKLMHKIRF